MPIENYTRFVSSRLLSIIISILLSFPAISQESDPVIDELNNKIRQADGVQKLKWLDSLSRYISYETDFTDDSIVRVTRTLAIELDSFNIALHHTSNLIFYNNYILGEPEFGKQLFEESKWLISRVTNTNAISKFFYDAGNSYFFLRQFDTALALYDSVETYARVTNYEEYIGLSKMGKGQVYTDMGDFGNASIELQDANRYFISINDTLNSMSARNSLSILYSKNGFFKEAKKERDELIDMAIQTGDLNSLPVYYYNAAADQRKTKDIAARIEYLKKAIDALDRTDYAEYISPIIYTGILLAYAEADSTEQMEKYLKIIDDNKEKFIEGSFRTFYLEALKEVEFVRKNYSNAIAYGEEYLLLMREAKQYEEIEFGENFLYRAYDAIGNTDKSFFHFRNYTALKDSINQAQKIRVLSYYQTLYETEKRDLTIQAQETNIALLEAKNKAKSQRILIIGLGFIFLFAFVWIMRSRNFARRKQKMQQNFTKDILLTQESERARIASELHDSVGQKLLVIKNSLTGKENVADVELVAETIKEVREMSHNLHPFQFEKLGLVKSLKNLIETFQKNSEIFYSEDIELADGLIDKEKEIYLFRMLQEGLSNVEKHASATACNLSSEELDDRVVFTLKDNGRGFKFSANKTDIGLGLKTLKERAQFIGANLGIQSAPAKGTIITISITKK